jgi:ribonuclease Y
MIPIAVAVPALLVLFVVALLVGRALRSPALPQTDEEKQRLIEAAKSEAESLKRQAALDAKELALKARSGVDAELRARQAELEKQAAEIATRERAIDKQERELRQKAEEMARGEKQLASRESAAEASARNAASQAAAAKVRLEKIASLTQAEARQQMLDEVRDEARREAAGDVKKIEDQARAEAEEKSKMIISAALQRYAGEYVTERTVATVPLPSDDMKGRIIGREGRNIRALEAATGIDLIIDDTPEAVVISCFNPVRREIARIALTRLIADGRIHPTRIEEMVEKATREIDQQCKDAGEQAAFDLGLGRIHPELVQLLGKLKFRSSNAQNLLQHSIEVGFLAGAARRPAARHRQGDRSGDRGLALRDRRRRREEAGRAAARLPRHRGAPRRRAGDRRDGPHRRRGQCAVGAAAGRAARDAGVVRAAAGRPREDRDQLPRRRSRVRDPGRARGARARRKLARERPGGAPAVEGHRAQGRVGAGVPGADQGRGDS